MGASLSQTFPTLEDCNRWAEQQARLAAQWNLQKTADLGNRPVVRVPVISPAGQPDELTLPLEPGSSVESRLRAQLARSPRFAGYREDRTRLRQPAFVRSLRFD
ncbi:MAG: hypothetical protein IT318_19040 [Anaerolineales bacterium]|nr:hypothetical protein [Anaerolineales bacterium]